MTETRIGRFAGPTRPDEDGARGQVTRRAVLGGVAAGVGSLAAAAPAIAQDSAHASPLVDARDFGVVGNGDADDTATLQAWLTHLVTNHKQGWLPNGTYKVTDTLVVPYGYGWSIHGESMEQAIISQATDNIPVMQVGTATRFSHTWSIDRLFLTYATPQPITNTNANNIVFEGDGNTSYHCRLSFMRFTKGYYALRMVPGKWGIWGGEFDNLICSNMSGGFYDSTGAIGGTPNNRWGRCLINCNDAVGPMFKEWRGYNMSIATLEFLEANNGPQLIQTNFGGFSADIGSLKLEIGTYAGAPSNLFQFPKASFIRIGSISVGGTTAVFTPTSGVLAIVGHVGPSGSHGFLNIGSIVADATLLSGNCVAVSAGADTRVSIDNVELNGGWTFQYTSGSNSGDYAKVNAWVNGTLSGSLGDADYTVMPGVPNVLLFDVAFSAPRTVTLPERTSNNLCAGLYYDIIFDGAINGFNTAVIRQGGNIMRTQTADGVKLSYMWRRGGSGGEWVLTGVVEIRSPRTGEFATGDQAQSSFDTDTAGIEAVAGTLDTLIAELKAKGIISA